MATKSPSPPISPIRRSEGSRFVADPIGLPTASEVSRPPRVPWREPARGAFVASRPETQAAGLEDLHEAADDLEVERFGLGRGKLDAAEEIPVGAHVGPEAGREGQRRRRGTAV